MPGGKAHKQPGKWNTLWNSNIQKTPNNHDIGADLDPRILQFYSTMSIIKSNILLTLAKIPSLNQTIYSHVLTQESDSFLNA